MAQTDSVWHGSEPTQLNMDFGPLSSTWKLVDSARPRPRSTWLYMGPVLTQPWLEVTQLNMGSGLLGSTTSRANSNRHRPKPTRLNANLAWHCPGPTRLNIRPWPTWLDMGLGWLISTWVGLTRLKIGPDRLDSTWAWCRLDFVWVPTRLGL